MATRYGPQTHQWLLEHGWRAVPDDPAVVGDPHVLMHVGEGNFTALGPYDALKMHFYETGEFPDFLPQSLEWLLRRTGKNPKGEAS